MIKKIYRSIVNIVVKKISQTSGGWYLTTMFQLRYKFFSLKNGIANNHKSSDSLFNFRRNIHRIEKGLVYEEQRSVFAELYIQETVNILIAGKKSGALDNDTIRWGESVLQKYFTRIEHSAVTRKAGKAFLEVLTTPESDSDWYPYPSSSRPELSVSYEDLALLGQRRRSVRYFESGPIDPRLIKKATSLAAMSPSACNRQSFHYLFYNDPEIAKELASIPGGVNGYELENVIVVVGNYSGYFDVRDVNAPIIDASLANMSLLFAFETLGLGSVCINWPNIPAKEKRIREVIQLEEGEFIIMLIGVGFPKDQGLIPYSGKRPIDNLLLVNKKIIK